MFGLGKRKREIFEYHDGARTRHADPIAVMRAMGCHPTLDLEQHLKELASEDLKLSSEASGIVVSATREIFNVRGWTEEEPNGLTELETIELLNAFVLYTDGLKKNGNGQPT